MRSSTSGIFFVQSSRLEIQKRSFSRFGVTLWNDIPRCVRDLPKRAFKSKIIQLLIDILENENDYVETPLIVQKVRLFK